MLRPGTEFLPLSVVTHKYPAEETCAEVEHDRALIPEAPLRCPDCGSPLDQVKALQGDRPPVRRRTSVSIGESGVARRGVLFTRETLEAGEQLAQRTEELQAARQINRELISRLNREHR